MVGEDVGMVGIFLGVGSYEQLVACQGQERALHTLQAGGSSYCITEGPHPEGSRYW